MSSYVSHKILLDGLEQAMTALNVTDWIVQTPGKLMGESGFEQWFDLTAKPSVEAGPIAVLDIFKEDEASGDILGLNIKTMDVKASLKILVGTRIWTDKEKSLAEQFGIQLLQAGESQELAREVVEILRQSLHYTNHRDQAK